MFYVFACLLQIANLDEVFGDLDGVEGCALADLVTAEPESKAVVVGKVLADTAYVDIILACGVKRHGVYEVLRVVLKGHARGGCDGFLCFFNADGLISLDPYAL